MEYEHHPLSFSRNVSWGEFNWLFISFKNKNFLCHNFKVSQSPYKDRKVSAP